MSELWALSARELLAGYEAREFSPVEVVDAVASRIESLNPSLGAFTTLCLDRARAEAGSTAGPLAGVPFAVKDLIDSEDVRTTYGSRMFRDHVPHRDADVVAQLRAAGALLVGKAQTHEFAWGITSINDGIGSAHNPWDQARVPGGSSGGPAVALAARMVPLAVGTDTGGSIRIPAGFCGVMGLKPTHGRVSARGVWPLAPSLDSVGPMARTPDDLELMLAAMEERAPAAVGARGLSGTTVVRCGDLLSKPLPPDRARVFEDAVRVIDGLGARVVERPFPVADLIDDTFRVVQACEGAKVHQDAGLFPARVEEYGGDVRHRLSYSAELDTREYLGAAADREVLRTAFGRLLHDDALLVSPISAVPPARSDDLVALHSFRSSVMPNTTPQNLAGLPAVAVRAGFDDDGLPVGIQFTAAPWRDEDALAAARAFYEATAETQARWP